jgi:hypothetical protein
MFSKTKIALSAAIVLAAALPASAATKHHRVTNHVTHVRPAGIYNMVPDSASGVCPPSGGPTCSNAGPAPPDSW